jgi:methionyl-tRNA formyltransferase
MPKIIKRLIFAGTPDFAKIALAEILHQGFEVVAVFTQPDRESGRGKKITKSAVKILAEQHNIAIYQPEKISENQTIIQNLKADAMVVVAFGQIIPQVILDIPKYGCFNIHASLLPRWRGAAPIQRAILAGDTHTGVGIMQMDAGLDTGNILLEKTCKISQNDTAQTLHDQLAIMGKNAIVEVLKTLQTLTPKSQTGVSTYAYKLKKSEANIDWQQNAQDICQKIRAFNSYPIAQCLISTDKFDKKILRILSAEVIQANFEQDFLQNKTQLVIKCPQGGLSLKRVQLSGKKPTDIQDFNNAYTLTQLHTD